MSSINVRSMQSSIDVIQTSLSAIQKFLGLVGTESNEVNLEKKYPGETAIIKDRIKTLQKAWEHLAKKFSIRNHEILNQNNIKKFWYDITQFEIWLTKIKIGMLSEEDPKTFNESETLLSKQDCVHFEIKKFKTEYNRILTVGERLTAAALISEDPEYYILKQRVQDLQKNWIEITGICKNRKDYLTKSRKSFISRCASCQTDPITPTSSVDTPSVVEKAPSVVIEKTPSLVSEKMKVKESLHKLEAVTVAVQNIISTTSTKLEEVICTTNLNNQTETSKNANTCTEKRGIFSGKYPIPRNTRRDSSLNLKRPERSQSLLNELSPSRKRDKSEEKICKITYNKNFTLKESSREADNSKEDEFDMGKCLSASENNRKFESIDKDSISATQNSIKYFENKKPSKLPF